jgi:hypothetical protein
MTVRCWAFLLLVALAGCGPKTIAQRTKDAEKLSDKIGSLLDEAERAMANVDPKTAEESLAEAQKLLADPDMYYSPEREMYASRHAEIAPKLEAAREARRLKDIEEAVTNERAEIGPSLQGMKDAAEAISTPKVDEKLIDAARDSVTALEKAVGASDERRLLALKEPSFMSYLKRAKTETEKARAEVTRAEKKLKFLTGPVALKDKASEELKQSKTEKDAEAKRTLVASAASGYGKCVSAGAEFTKGGFGAEKILIGGSTTSVESVLETCKASQQSTEQALAKLPKPKAKPPPKAAPKPGAKPAPKKK